MTRQIPSNATSIKGLDKQLNTAIEAALVKEDPLSASFTLNPRPTDLSAQGTAKNEQELKFTDPLLIKALNEQLKSGMAYGFECWGKPGLDVVDDALVFASKSIDIAFQNIGRKLRDADKHFRDTCGGNDPMFLSSFEAACIFRSYMSMTGRLEHAENLVRLFSHFLCTRQRVISEHEKAIAKTQAKVQELLWSCFAERAAVFGKALNGAGIDGADLATLQAKSDMQSLKIDVLEAQLDLLSAMNKGCQEHINDIQNFGESMKYSDCRWGHIPKLQNEMKKLDWQAYQKEIKDLKRVVQSAMKRSEESEAQVKEMSQEMMMRFINVLLEKVKELGGESLANSLTQQVFGSLIGAAGVESFHPSGVEFFELIPTIDLALKKSGLPPASNTVDQGAFDYLRRILSLKSYFPDALDDYPWSGDKWVSVTSSDLIACKTESRTAVAEANQARKELEDQFEYVKKSYVRSEHFRGLYDSHILSCKKSIDKGHAADKRVGEWADKIVELFPSNDDLHSGWTMLPEMEKLDRLTRTIKGVIRDREEAIRKTEPLFKKLAQKEKALIEKDTLIANAREAQDQRVEDKNKQVNEMTLKLDRKEAERRSAIADVDKVKNEWQKKLQRAYDKTAALEKQLRVKDEELNTTKLDYEATQAQLSEKQMHLEKVKEAGRAEVKKSKELQRERDEARSQMLSLKSNEEIVKDRIAKAVNAAVKKVEDEKNARIADLEDLLAKRDQARLADEETIRELSRVKEDHMKCKTGV